jgi:hypothetical protein
MNNSTFQGHVTTVVSADEMSDDIFILHFENRHGDQLPDLDGFVDTIYQQPELISAYRTFHDRLHELHQIRERHEHEG